MNYLVFYLLCVGVFNILHPTCGKRGKNTVCYNVIPLMTTSNGAPAEDKLTSMSAGVVGPLVLQDFLLLDDLAHFTHERIPERVTNAKGAGAYGHFTVTDNTFAAYCRASVFEAIGKQTRVMVRFSTSTQGAGSCDSVREPRGAAIKFYTDDGNFDLVGLNSPVFFIRDPILYPSLVHSQRRNPSSNLHDPDMFWDFVTLRPETTHQLLFQFSDRGLPTDYRHMNIYGCHTFKVVNREGIPYYCKFTFKTDQGIKHLEDFVARHLCGIDPEYSTRDLYLSIYNRTYPSWTLYYQLMTYEQATQFPWNPFDATKIWPQKDYPLREIGKLVLNRNPVNYFAEVEQAAFSPSHLVPGIEPSPDKLLQARLFAYPDAQRYRLGVNYQQLPVNAPPEITVANNQRDGAMCFGYKQGGSPNYFPSSSPDALRVCPGAAHSKWTISGDVARYNADNQDNYGQATLFWMKTLNEPQKERLAINLASHLKKASPDLQIRALGNFKNVSEEFAEYIAAALSNPMV